MEKIVHFFINLKVPIVSGVALIITLMRKTYARVIVLLVSMGYGPV
jgi:hypothetical protein